jgi:hypothetical protein
MINLFWSISKPEIIGNNFRVKVQPRKWFIVALKLIALIQFLLGGRRCN